MSRRVYKTPGWAAFDLKQREKDHVDEIDKDEPYPPFSSATTPSLPVQKNKTLPVRSFSSVLLPSLRFPALPNVMDQETPILAGNSSGTATHNTEYCNEIDIRQACLKLKELHSWADESLISDVMAGVDNEIDRASSLLKSMVSSESFEQTMDQNIVERMVVETHDSLGKSTGLSEVSDAQKDCVSYNNEELVNNLVCCGNKVSDAALHMNLILDLRSLPVEPEWEEDDIYLVHRKDALRAMRSASHHSRAAAEAYLKGDHFSAQQLSAKAREERIVAKQLNAVAAKEILGIRNSENGLWKLDLHGLHALEAIQALQDRLEMLETMVPLDRDMSQNKNHTQAALAHSASLDSLSGTSSQNLNNQCESSRKRPTLLHVITGRGNHSRGQAALPTAIKDFLNENRYRYDEARPGLITVKPKFRRQ